MRRKLFSIIAAAALAAGAHTQAQTPPPAVLSLEDCERMGGAAGPEVRKAELDVSSAKYQRREALWHYFPTVQLSSMGFYAMNPLINITYREVIGGFEHSERIYPILESGAERIGLSTKYQAMQWGWGATAVATQPIFAGGRIVTANELAKLGVSAAEEKLAVERRLSSSETGTKFWKVAGLLEKQSALKDAIAAVESLEKDLESASGAGLVSSRELESIRGRLSLLRSQQARLRSGIRLAKMDLFNYIGCPYTPYSSMASDSLRYIDDIGIEYSFDGLREPSEYYVPEEEAVALMSESRLLDFQVRAAELEKRMDIGAALPEIGVGGLYGYAQYVGEPRFNGAVFASVKIPLTAWGPAVRQIERRNNEIRKARIDRDYLREQLTLKLRLLWMELQAAWDEMGVAEENLNIAAGSYSDLEASFGAGLAGASDLTQSRLSLREAENALTDARIAYREAVAAYLLMANKTEIF